MTSQPKTPRCDLARRTVRLSLNHPACKGAQLAHRLCPKQSIQSGTSRLVLRTPAFSVLTGSFQIGSTVLGKAYVLAVPLYTPGDSAIIARCVVLNHIEAFSAGSSWRRSARWPLPVVIKLNQSPGQILPRKAPRPLSARG